ncbi:conserved hypothetical protein [Mesorhizobium ventifaucium]|uniref:Uncharacterized protein n=1 Tax=Mesorhizobium ventifaucium TaxID=666020 RepID=A0ABN8JWC5_9HYPH|nr:conserved hypothetical protein [Mesorhizobium ventifaucium]
MANLLYFSNIYQQFSNHTEIGQTDIAGLCDM